jgi:hypothetical protein
MFHVWSLWELNEVEWVKHIAHTEETKNLERFLQQVMERAGFAKRTEKHLVVVIIIMWRRAVITSTASDWHLTGTAFYLRFICVII